MYRKCLNPVDKSHTVLFYRSKLIYPWVFSDLSLSARVCASVRVWFCKVVYNSIKYQVIEIP